MTNAEKIRQMTDDEMKEFLKQLGCPPTGGFLCGVMGDDCLLCWGSWLRKQAEDK